MEEVNGMDEEENTSQLNQQSLSPVLDENTSFTKQQFSQIVRDADWNELSESSFKLHSKENSTVLATGSDCSTEDVLSSGSLKTSLCASPDRKDVLRNKNTRSKNIVLEPGKFQEVLQKSTDTDESCIESRKSIKSGFRRKKNAATSNKRTSKFASTEFFSALHSSTESIDRSKLSVTVNSEDSVILALKEKKSSCFTRKKSFLKKTGKNDFQNIFHSSEESIHESQREDDSVNKDKINSVTENETVNSEDSVILALKEKKSSCFNRKKSFLKKRGKNDFQNIFHSSEESIHGSQREDDSVNKDKTNSVTENENFNCDKDNIELKKSSSEKTHNEEEENLLNEKTDNITEVLRNCDPPETDEVELSLTNRVNAEKEENLVDQLNCSKSSRETSAEESQINDKSGTHIENASKSRGEVMDMDAIERSFTGTGLHSASLPSLVISKVSDVSSRSYLSNLSVQENSLIRLVSNDSPIKPREIIKPDSLSSLVLKLDYDSMDSDSDTDDSRTPPSDNNVNALKSKVQSDETSFKKGTEKDISNNSSLRRSSRQLSKTNSYINKNSQNNSTKKNVHEKSATKSRTLTKSDDIITSTVMESNSFNVSKKGIGSKAAIVNRSNNVQGSNASDYYNSLETTYDDSVAGPNNYSLQNITNKEESIFKVPTADISSRVLSLRRKNSQGAQNITAQKNCQSTKNSSAGDKSVYRENDSNENFTPSKTKRRKSSRNTPQSNNENSSENAMLNSYSIDSRLRRGFSELKRKCNNINMDGDRLLIEKVFSYGNKNLQEVNGNGMDVEENYLNNNVRLKKPKRWVTDHLYNFLIKKLEPKYEFKARFRAEKFVEFLCEKYDVVVKEKDDFKRYVDELVLEMAKLHIIVNVFDFYNFVLKFLPYAFYEKSVPCTRPFGLPNIVAPPPAGTLFDKLL